MLRLQRVTLVLFCVRNKIFEDVPFKPKRLSIFKDFQSMKNIIFQTVKLFQAPKFCVVTPFKVMCLQTFLSFGYKMLYLYVKQCILFFDNLGLTHITC